MIAAQRDDIHQWLNDCWVLVEDPAKTRGMIPAKYKGLPSETEDDVDGVQEEFLIQVKKLNHASERSVPLDGAELWWPICGAVNIEEYKCAVYLKRRPMKQWRRSYCHRQVDVSLPRKWETMQRVGSSVADLTSDCGVVINALWQNKYFTYSEAVKAISEENWISAAISPFVTIYSNGGFGEMLVFYRTELVGQILEERILRMYKEGSIEKRIRKTLGELAI